MDNRDRAFLRDVTNFTFMNHVATAYALQDAFINPLPVARLTEDSLESPKQIAVTEVSPYIKKTQSIMVTKIFAELMSAYEDLGALCSAIRHRAKHGIFERYFRSSVREADSFLREIYNNDLLNASKQNLELSTVLRLPPISDFANNISAEDLSNFKYDYLEIPKRLYGVAEEYCATLDSMDAILPQNANNANSVPIILSTENNPQSLRLTVAFNKVKHRFMASENIFAYDDPSRDRLIYGTLSAKPKDIKMRINNTITVSRVIGEIASLLLVLDEIGINI